MQENLGCRYVQVVSPNFDGSFVDSIGRDAVEAYKSRMRRFPIERERTLVCDQNKGTLALQFCVEGEVRKVAEFCYGYVDAVLHIEYCPQFWFEDVYLVDLVLEKEKKGIIIPSSSWGKKEMLRIFQKQGLIFTLDRKESEILSIFSNYLAGFLHTREILKFDSRAGWFKGDVWAYRTADTWPMPEIPSIVREKTLGIDGPVNISRIAKAAEWLKGIRQESLRLLVLSILYVGVSFSRIFRMMKLVQGKYIIFSFESERIRFFLENFFRFFAEDSACKVSLSMPAKDLVKILKSCKDQIVVIDVDAEDISGRRKQNIALLRQYVCGGNLPEGEPAESLVVFITNGIPKGISFDDAMVFSVHNNDFDDGFLEVDNIRFRAAELVAFFVEDIQKDERRFKMSFTKTKNSASLDDILRIGGNMVIELMKGFQLFENSERICKKLVSELKAAEEFSDMVGIGGVVSEVLISKVQSGELRLKRVNQRVEREELKDVILYDKKAFYLSDALIKQAIISEIASVDITVIILRKYLATEGFLLQYESESGEKSYKKKRILKAGDGGHYSVWMTAILQKKVGETVDIEIEELLEDIGNE